MILMMGIAGSGKGTQGQMLADRLSYKLVSMGDVVRANLTDEQRERMMSGTLLDDQEIITMLDKVLGEMESEQGIILDGFPRTIIQAEWLVGQAREGRFNLEAAFHLVASREAVKERLLGRARGDDKAEAIAQRFDEYERSTMPLINWLKNNGVKVIDINAERNIEDIHQDLASRLG